MAVAATNVGKIRVGGYPSFLHLLHTYLHKGEFFKIVDAIVGGGGCLVINQGNIGQSGFIYKKTNFTFLKTCRDL